MKNISKKSLALVLSLLCVLSAFTFGLTAFADEDREIYKTLDDLEGKKLIIFSGTNSDTLSEQQWGDPEFVYVQTAPDMIVALKSKKGDAIITDYAYAKYIVSQEEGLALINESLEDQDLGFAFAKNSQGAKFQKEFNDFIYSFKDGELEEILDMWCDVNSEKPVLDLSKLDGKNGTFRFATDPTAPPTDYKENGNYAGYEIDLIYRFCKQYGYKLQITDLSFDGLLPSLVSGKQDCVGCCIAITPERAESVNFSAPIATNKVVPIIRAENSVLGESEKEDISFFASVAKSFRKTFIDENRWKDFISGIEVTLIISAASVLFGTLLGFALYMWFRSGSKISGGFTGAFSWTMFRMPIVVLLMIIYYVIFGKIEISGLIVSIIAFTLVFAGSVYSMLRSGVDTVDGGQLEAGLALGYTPIKAFFKIVFPQAAYNFMPSYKAEIISLIKSTAVVGYVAVQDLTKVSDLIRSRTYDAYFPLIATAIIYIILSDLVANLIGLAGDAILSKKGKTPKMLKGVKTDD